MAGFGCPPRAGPKGPLFSLREAVAALVDAGFLGSDSPTRWRDFGSDGGRESGARELAEAVMDALAKRLDKAALRPVCEAVVAELHQLIGVIFGCADRPETLHGAALDWPALSDADLERALRSLIDDGYLPFDDDKDGAA